MKKSIGKKLPIVISVPHGGTKVPNFLRNNILMNQLDILLDSDTWSQELYDFQSLVEEHVTTDISRIVVDMNRDRNDLPPSNSDGVVKSHSVIGKQVWQVEHGLSSVEIQHLLKSYHIPYHQRLERASKNPLVVLGIDCHTMLDVGPPKVGNKWNHRPLFCISNRGTPSGAYLNEPITAPVEMMLTFKGLLESKFDKYKQLTDKHPLVTINEPFTGGYITKHHGSLGHIPWIQLEINRRLYLPEDINQITDTNEQVFRKLQEIRDGLFDVFYELIDGTITSDDNNNKVIS